MSLSPLAVGRGAHRSSAGDTVIFQDPLRFKEGEGGGKNTICRGVSPSKGTDGPETRPRFCFYLNPRDPPGIQGVGWTASPEMRGSGGEGQPRHRACATSPGMGAGSTVRVASGAPVGYIEQEISRWEGNR